MNLDDLRQELNTRADEAGQPDLLAGVHHRIRRTKQRRLATALTATAAVAAVALGVVPNALTTTKDPDPAVTPTPSDYRHNGLVFGANENGSRLEKAWAGKKGENAIEFQWTPSTTDLTLTPYCADPADGSNQVKVSFNGLSVVPPQSCADAGPEATQRFTLGAWDEIWTSVGHGMQPIRIKVEILTPGGTPVTGPEVQVGLGIYRTGQGSKPPADSFPSRPIEAGPKDVVRDGIRYPGKLGDETLAAAVIGAQGENSVSLRWTPTSYDVTFAKLCVAAGSPDQPMARFTVNGRRWMGFSCDESAQQGRSSSSSVYYDELMPLRGLLKLGEENVITLQLTSSTPPERRLTDKNGRLGFAIYQHGPSHQVVAGSSLRLAERIHHNGFTYKLQGFKTAPAESNARVRMDGPADKPFLLVAGGYAEPTNTPDDQTRKMTITGLPDELQATHSGPGMPGISTIPVPSQRARTLAATLSGPTNKDGYLFMAIYLPVP
ncbi:hypothetical protein [Kribbella deserti]|uniref:Uncharacterized protein n=1 Tax=Kribbella deserti TaxID=1926257 RepID=A0ABV6QVF2_9ACTN